MNYRLTIMFFFFTPLIFAQTNLVPNRSYEQFTACPTNGQQIYLAFPWHKVYPNGASPHYFNACDTTNEVGVPLNLGGFENAHSGVAYAGIYTFIEAMPNVREYLEVQLTDSLLNGQKYYAEFFVSLADSFYFACNNIGMLFSNDSITSSNYYNLSCIPQIYNTSDNPLTNKNGWTKISGTFTANGGEKYLVIGNFIDDANSDTVFVGGNSTNYYWRQAFYYIDDVTVMRDTIDGLNEVENNYTFKLFPNPATNDTNT